MPSAPCGPTRCSSPVAVIAGLPRSPRCHLSYSPVRFAFWSGRRPRPPRAPFPLVTPVECGPGYSVADMPLHLPRPDYALQQGGEVDPANLPAQPVVWTEQQLEGIRAACRLAAEVLREVGAAVGPGVSTHQLDLAAKRLITQAGAFPSMLNFHGYPRCISTSVNNVAAHGVPDLRELQPGDLLNIDLTVFLAGYHGDCSDTFLVGGGDPDPGAEHLVTVTR